MRTTPVPDRARRRSAGAVVVLIVAVSLITGRPAAADAGPDLVFSAPGGPAGSEVELRSADLFDMDVDMCPGMNNPDNPYGPGDSFEVRWELGVLAGPGHEYPLGADQGFRYAQLGDPVTDVVATGVVETVPDVPWRTTITIPEGVQVGQHLVANAACWRMGPDVPGGEQVYFTYYYLAVFVVTGPDGVVPPTPSTTAPTTAPPPPAPGPTPGAPAPTAPAASARPGSASFTG